MTEDLKPCPFCGSAAKSDNGFLPCESVTYAWCSNQDCSLCTIEFGFTVEQWNTRALESRVVAESDKQEAVYQTRSAAGSKVWMDVTADQFAWHQETHGKEFVRIVYAHPIASAEVRDAGKTTVCLPSMPKNVLSDIQSTVTYLEMWAKGEARYAPKNAYDEPGLKKATISDVKKSAKYLAPILKDSSFALQDYFSAIDAAIAANRASEEGGSK